MRQRNELVPFMLLRHDDERQAVRELTEKEYASIVGGSFDPKREVTSCCNTTIYRCNRTTGACIEMRDHATDDLDEEDLDSGLMTMEVTCEQLTSTTYEQFRLAPCFIQKGIQKAYELRIVFVDDTAFAFRVDSQEHKLTSTDWRYGNSFLPFEPVQLPVDVLDMLKTLMKRSRLHTGSVDIVVDTHGDYWFLEVNQDGA